jgi:uncharacterized protein (TIGR02466 family)
LVSQGNLGIRAKSTVVVFFFYLKSNPGGFLCSSLFKEPCLQDLAKFVHSAVTTVHTHTGLAGELNFTQSWANINRKYSYHEQHHHCPNIWSGVYYVQARDNDATICFVNSNIINSSWPYKADKIYNNDLNSSQTVCRVNSGMLLIFPSYLQHKVSQHMSDNERISIAFNMDLK